MFRLTLLKSLGIAVIAGTLILGVALGVTSAQTPAQTPAPTATEILGPMGIYCGGAENSHVAQYRSCWQLMLNGHLININAGRLGDGDPNQGAIQVRELGADDRYHLIGTYLTPSKQGAVDIASVDGTRVYLVHSPLPPPLGDVPTPVTPVPNFVFVFDLATDQWVSP